MMDAVIGADDAVFRALSDPTRRALLDRLRERNGQTLAELCRPLAMARQSATQHLGVLEAANLVTVVRRGREKLHYLNPVPLWELQERWIGMFEPPRLRALSAIKQKAEANQPTEETAVTNPSPDASSHPPTYVYVTYIESSPEQVWHALTDADLTGQFWGHSNVSDWQPGSGWEHRRLDGSGVADVNGTVLAAEPPRRLSITFEDGPGGGERPQAQQLRGASRVTFDIEPYHEIVRLTVTHENLADEKAYNAISAGWPAVMANLKSLLETGHVLPRPPWDMDAEPRAARLAAHDRT
jgi:uncharacterized protein YndB with AHSA1/START domain/DNA-binding transcriptional ArsR family regulator